MDDDGWYRMFFVFVKRVPVTKSGCPNQAHGRSVGWRMGLAGCGCCKGRERMPIGVGSIGIVFVVQQLDKQLAFGRYVRSDAPCY